MELPVPLGVIQGLDLTEEQWRFDLALGLYIDDRVTAGRAAEIAGISKPAFLDELGKHRLPIRYDAQDLESDLVTIATLP